MRIAVLGSTGSIGRQAIEVASRASGEARIVALAAGTRLDQLEAQARTLAPSMLALEHAGDAAAARTRLEAACPGARVRVGPGSAAWLAEESEAEVVVNGIVGAAGLDASLRTLARGARLALANKETLVVGGPLVRAALARGGELIPIDSEHSAALQCLGGRPAGEVRKLTLTASGGALREHPDWRRATPAEVLRHPVWAMGGRITVDSALLVNKALELIEAHWLFGLDWEQMEAWLHPQALFHALVTFRDGSTVAQAAPPDMRLPIQVALTWPSHGEPVITPLDLKRLESLSFDRIVPGRFPAFDLALAAGRAGGTAPCVLNAADEVAVAAFLDQRLTLGQVPDVLSRTLSTHGIEPVESLEQLRAVDQWARASAGEAIRDLAVRA
ncbi:MAG TPA: 1-deoxy-D-xylulose-5-phosphate reductoisomerase [Candidatus Udaeobacter sp.]|jgi:1-deoxy-D-xylulose-5-phosphate reductoisomerase|nr:1-deoxy-D-xylulose-5-phosphate reductoisomerase [Candidatus Udaeobacter sp.]